VLIVIAAEDPSWSDGAKPPERERAARVGLNVTTSWHRGLLTKAAVAAIAERLGAASAESSP
jgi:hypothetical protein